MFSLMEENNHCHLCALIATKNIFVLYISHDIFIQGVIKALKENLELVTKKAVERKYVVVSDKKKDYLFMYGCSNLSVQYERAVEETRRQEHSLQEATLKLQVHLYTLYVHSSSFRTTSPAESAETFEECGGGFR